MAAIGNKKSIRILIVSVLILFSIFFVLQWCAKNYITDFLSQKIPPHLTVAYSGLDINILSKTVTLHNISLKIENTDTLQNPTYLKSEILQLKGISYWNLLFDETLSINNFILKKPKLNYYPYKHVTSKKTETNTKAKEIKTIKINEVNITNGSLNIINKSTDTTKFYVSNYNLTVIGSKINLHVLDASPVTYDSFKLDATHIISNYSDYEIFKIDRITTDKKSIYLENLRIIPKYDKKELSTHLNKEHDYINLKIPQIVLQKLHFSYCKNRFGIRAISAHIKTPNLEIFRDKLLPDDLSIKPFYGKSLRNLPFNLDVNEVKVKNGYISYAELVERDKKAGKLFFSNVDATIHHISNLKHAKKTDIKVQSKLMAKAPFELNWNFDVNNTSDSFLVSGSVSNLSTEILNPFFKPNLNAVTEGEIQQMYFTFYGNTIQSKGEMKMKYENFKFKILRENGFKINKLLTTIGNIFIDEASKTDTQKFRYGAIEAERDATKSFFNYLWINIKSGFISTLTGNGKKE